MLIQLHHQYKDDSTTYCAQRDVKIDDDKREFVEDIKKSHPLPPGARWLMCWGDSKYFKKGTQKGT